MNCYICNKQDPKYQYENYNSEIKGICENCNDIATTDDRVLRTELSSNYRKKIKYFGEKKMFDQVRLYSNLMLLLNNKDISGLFTLAKLGFHELKNNYAQTEIDQTLKAPNINKSKLVHLIKSTVGKLRILLDLNPDNRHILKLAEKTYLKLKLYDKAAECGIKLNEQGQDFNEMVYENSNIRTDNGIMVQSNGEAAIANFLHRYNIDFDYDEQITLKGNEINQKGFDKTWVRPDFYLTEFDIIIEYWGMKGTKDYDKNMITKKRLYKEANKKFISITPDDLSRLKGILKTKLARHGCNV